VPNGTLGTPYSQKLTASGGYSQAETEWTIRSGALPDGLMLNSMTGVISGTPTATGTFNFTVRVYRSSCHADRSYTIEVKAHSATTLTVSDNPVSTGQMMTLTVQVSVPLGGTPTGTVQFTVDGSPVGTAVPLVDGSASVNTVAPDGGTTGHFASASYSGDVDFLPSSTSLTLSVFDYSIQDDATDDALFFNSDGTYLFIHFAGESSLVLKGQGMILPSARGCTLFLEHSASDRYLTAEVDTCQQTATATVMYQRETYILSQGSQ
jgi:hypothetical protein